MKPTFRVLLPALLLCLASLTTQAQTLRIGLAEDPDVLDPSLARTFVGRVVFASLCDKLGMVCRQQGPDHEAAPGRAVP